MDVLKTLVIFLSFSSLNLTAQSDCVQEFEKKYESGEYEAALTISQTCIEIDLDPELRFFKTRCLMYQEEYEKAIPNYRALLATDGKNVDFLNGLGAAYYVLDQDDTALVYYSMALEIDPSNVKALMNRSILYADFSEVEKAEKDAAQLEAANGDDSDYWVNLGDAFYISELDTEALDAYKKAININPNNYKAYRSRAEYYSFKEEHDLGLSYIEKAIAINKKDPLNYHLKGEILYFMDDLHYKEAIKSYSKSFSLEENADVAYYMGLCYDELDDFEKAEKYYRKSIELGSAEVDCYNYLAYLLILSDELEEALELSKEAVKLNPNDYYAYGLQGNIYYDLGEYKKSIVAYTKAMNVDKTKEHFYYLERGLSYKELGDHNSALEDFTNALEVGSNWRDACSERAKVYIQKEEYELAIVDLDRLISFGRGTADTYSYRAACHYKLGDLIKACMDMHSAADFGSSDAKKYVKQFCE
jgi:tetratricopeptide (TPR) repeat protein